MAEAPESLNMSPAREAVESEALPDIGSKADSSIYERQGDEVAVESETLPEEDREEIVSDSLVYGRDVPEWEALWESLLPKNYEKILSRAVDPVEYSSKKELYFRLHQPLLLDQGTKSFVLDMTTGKKCYTFSARALWITWGDNLEYWKWVHHPDSRFAEVAELLAVCWLAIYAEINSSELSPNTTYSAYLIFKLPWESSYGFANETQKASVSIGTATPVESIVRLDPREEDGQGGQVPIPRKDGWMELCLGKFYNHENMDVKIEIALKEVEILNWKGGLVLEGIEVRPNKQ